MRINVTIKLGISCKVTILTWGVFLSFYGNFLRRENIYMTREEFIELYLQNLHEKDILEKAQRECINVYKQTNEFYENTFRTQEELEYAIKNAYPSFNMKDKYVRYDNYLETSNNIEDLVDIRKVFGKEIAKEWIKIKLNEWKGE